MDERSAFSYPVTDYIEILIVACGAGLIKYLNSDLSNYSVIQRITRGVVAVITSGFSGVMTFWVLKSWQAEVSAPAMYFMAGVSGLMGMTTWKYFETLWKKKFEILMLLAPKSMEGADALIEDRERRQSQAHGAQLEPQAAPVNESSQVANKVSEAR